ncbi:hypothetical protein TAF16_2220 [Anoxybacillus flavithermus]|uniref:Uncharacterized protein n=1 Tax=Anoxybacillus flavithermus TaxID=33934 RepID=A0A178T6Z6_9BACL|nr:hypothetical protein TAF16_2220 [Anoxybacillus flavithermus]
MSSTEKWFYWGWMNHGHDGTDGKTLSFLGAVHDKEER